MMLVKYEVTLHLDTPYESIANAQGDVVMSERMGHDEDYGFHYVIAYNHQETLNEELQTLRAPYQELDQGEVENPLR